MVRLLRSVAGLWAVGTIASPLQTRSEPKTYEAENAVLSGTTVEKSVAGFTGMCQRMSSSFCAVF